ncbi:MAG TPA: hypothetical protein VEI97_05275 [bacterium]|nr:hypothetical protein [bacterium]
MIYIGIDPGVSGAIAALYPDNEAVVWDMPTLEVSNGKQVRRSVNPAALGSLLNLFHTRDNVEAVIEDVHAMPGQGVTSMFNFGVSLGVVIGAMAALRVPYTRVRPMTWKKRVMGDMGKDKDAAVARACQLFPEVADQLVVGKTKKDGRAEALLLAWYLRETRKALQS